MSIRRYCRWRIAQKMFHLNSIWIACRTSTSSQAWHMAEDWTSVSWRAFSYYIAWANRRSSLKHMVYTSARRARVFNNVLLCFYPFKKIEWFIFRFNLDRSIYFFYILVIAKKCIDELKCVRGISDFSAFWNKNKAYYYYHHLRSRV